jgi:hypothetical protein
VVGSLRKAASWTRLFPGGNGRDGNERPTSGLGLICLSDAVYAQVEIEAHIREAYAEGKDLWTKEMLEKLGHGLER